MKRYEVWAKCPSHPRCSAGESVVLEFEDTESEGVCEAACADAVDTMIGNCFDTGWNLLEDGEEPEVEK